MASQYNRLTKVLAKSLKLDEKTLVESFCLARLDDIPTVSALRRKVFGELILEDDESYLKWRYFGRSDFPSTLLVYRYNNKVIAAVGTEPVELFNQGSIEPAIRSMDAIVEPEFNNRGLGAWMNLAIQHQNSCILTTGGNENSTSMLNKLFTPLPARKNYKIILHSRNFLNHKSHSFLNALVAPLIDIVVSLYLKVKWRSGILINEQKLTYFKDVNLLLQHDVDPQDCLADIKVIRSNSYLQWRYAGNPREEYYAIGVFEQDKLVAYVIYSFDDKNEQDSIGIGHIMDWSVSQQIQPLKVLTSLFIETIKDLQMKGADEVIMVLNDRLSSQAAKAAGFIFRNVESSLFVYHADLAENNRFYSADAWYQSLGDSDV